MSWRLNRLDVSPIIPLGFVSIQYCKTYVIVITAPLHCQTRTPNAAIGAWDPSPDLCNVNIQHITIAAKGKTPPTPSPNLSPAM